MPRRNYVGPTDEQFKAITDAVDAIDELLGLDPEGGDVMIEPGRWVCLNGETALRLVELARAGKALLDLPSNPNGSKCSDD